MVQLAHEPEGNISNQFLPNRQPIDNQPSEAVMISSGRATTSTNVRNDTTSPCLCQCGRRFCACYMVQSHFLIIGRNLHARPSRRTADECILQNPDNFSGPTSSSVEASEPRGIRVAEPSLDLMSKLDDESPAYLAGRRAEQCVQDMDDAPFSFYISEEPTPDQTLESSSMVFGPLDDDDGSMVNHPASSESASSSLFSYESALSRRGNSASASAVIKHVGAVFGSRRSSAGEA